jgi:penicillin-binding protein 1A
MGRLRRLQRAVKRLLVHTLVVALLVLVLFGPQAVVTGVLGWWGLRSVLRVRRGLRGLRGKPATPELPIGSLPAAPPVPARWRAWARACTRLAAYGALILAGLGLVLSAGAGYLFWTLPNVQQIDEVASNVDIVFDKQGDVLELRQAIVTLQVPLAELPVYLKDALLTMEDRRFYAHPGIDYLGVARALRQLLRGQADSGGSTITQQLAKNLFLSHDRTALRKLKEALLALKLEWHYSKDQLLEMYLNRIYFGRGANGIEAAARVYFAKRARELTVYEAALLVGWIPSPERWNLSANEEAARRRAELVLSEMERLGKLKRTGRGGCCIQRGDRGWHRVDAVALFEAMRGELIERLRGRNGRMVVVTTVDPDLQIHAERAVSRRIAQARAQAVSEGALAALGMDGAIRALVGSADRSRSTLNHATQTRRQLGSVFKPFVFAAALEKGLRPSDTVSGRRLQLDGWSPRNADDRYPEAQTLTEALAESRNTAAVRVMLQTGRGAVLEMASRLGLEASEPPGPGIALGTGESTLLGVTRAYVPFASGGHRAEPYLVVGIRDKLGRILYWRRNRTRRRVLARQRVADMNAMLSEVLRRGTGRRAAFGNHPLAGKTGTTQDERDAWFIGYSAHLVAGVWVGNDDATPMRGVSGATLPAEIWRNFMASAHESLRLQPLPLPGL